MNALMSTPPMPAAHPRTTGRKWCWYSTLETGEQGMPSVLAVCETCIAVGIYAWIAIRYGTLHLTIAACIAPLLLLRTPESTELALRWCRHFDSELRPRGWKYPQTPETPPSGWHRWVSILASLLVLPLLPLAMIVVEGIAMIYFMFCRAAAITTCTFRRPLHSIGRIPANWWRFVVCIDSAHPVEAVPGAALEEKQLNAEPTMLCPLELLRNMSTYIESKTPLERFFETIVWRSAQLGVFCSLFIPALFHRLSIKGTAILFSPLILMVRRTFKRRAEDITKRAYHSFVRGYSAFILTLFTAKLFHLAFPQIEIQLLSDGVGFWRKVSSVPLLAAYLMPYEIPPWQIAIALNAALAFIVYWAADYAEAHSEEKWWDTIMRFGFLFRGALTVYAVLCNIYIAASLIPQLKLPALGTRIFPAL